jgi:hypothetical protein
MFEHPYLMCWLLLHLAAFGWLVVEVMKVRK